MSTNDLTAAEMAYVVHNWTANRRALFERVPWLTPLLEPLDALDAAFLAACADPQAERRARVAALDAAARRLDDDFRALDDLLAGLAAWARDPVERAALAQARAEVLPEGRALLKRTVSERAAAGVSLAGRLRAPTRETLARYSVGGRSLLDHVTETLAADAEAVRSALIRRMQVPLRPSKRRRGGGRRERQRFALALRTMRTLWRLHGEDVAIGRELFLVLDDLVSKAGLRRRRRQRGAAEQSEGVAPGAAGAEQSAAGRDAAASLVTGSGAEGAPGDAGAEPSAAGRAAAALLTAGSGGGGARADGATAEAPARAMSGGGSSGEAAAASRSAELAPVERRAVPVEGAGVDEPAAAGGEAGGAAVAASAVAPAAAEGGARPGGGPSGGDQVERPEAGVSLIDWVLDVDARDGAAALDGRVEQGGLGSVGATPDDEGLSRSAPAVE
ncbi:MAG: hypothetical protein R3F65_19655 [bacterium]